jgi:hypothetical protein
MMTGAIAGSAHTDAPMPMIAVGRLAVALLAAVSSKPFLIERAPTLA